jgi:hypothetical protein
MEYEYDEGQTEKIQGRLATDKVEEAKKLEVAGEEEKVQQ